MRMKHRHDTAYRLPWHPLAAAITLASLAFVTAAPAVAQDGWGGGQMGNQGIFDPRSSGQYYYGGQDYSQLRPWLRDQRYGHDPRTYGPPPAFPRTSIFGDHSRYYGGADYGGLRPGGPWGPGPDYNMPASPRTGIFGPDSRLYGGSDYSLIR
jgi:hypothetical protein